MSSYVDRDDPLSDTENIIYSSTIAILNSFFRMKTIDFSFSGPDQDYQLETFLPSSINEWGIILAWVLLRRLCKEENMPIISRSRIDEWFFGRVLKEQMKEFPTEKCGFISNRTER